MKVLVINGSPRRGGNTSIAIAEMQKVFDEAGVETKVVQVGNKDVRGCTSCYFCKKNGRCVFDDVVNEVASELEGADGLVAAAAVYFGSANGTVSAFMDRLFYSTPFDKTIKVGAAVAVARRGGTSATYDELNKYFALTGMPIATGQYWNGVFGREKGEAAQDSEGLQQMRTLARNMVFLMKSIEAGKREFGLPEKEPFERLNFIR